MIFATLIPLGIPRCNCNQRVFPRNCYISRESIRLGIKKCICNCNLQKIPPPSKKLCNHFDWGRAKGDGPKVMEPNLRFPAVFCENLRFSATICGFLRPPNAGICRRRGESAKICGFLRKSAFWALSVTLGPSP